MLDTFKHSCMHTGINSRRVPETEPMRVCRNRTREGLQSLPGGQEPGGETVPEPGPERPAPAQLFLQEHGGDKSPDQSSDFPNKAH